MKNIVIFGANGVLGRNLIREFSSNPAYHCIGISRALIRNYEQSTLLKVFRNIEDATILNCIGVLPDTSQSQPTLSKTANYDVVKNIVSFMKVRPEFNFIQMSTSLVFDGSKIDPYVESDTPNPISVYGKHKVDSENLILDEIADQSAIYRFGSLITRDLNDRTTFSSFLRLLKSENLLWIEKNRSISLADSLLISKTFDVHQTNNKILHISHSNIASWKLVLDLIISSTGIQAETDTLREESPLASLNVKAPRPKNSSLTSEVSTIRQQIDWEEIVLRNIDI